MVITIDLEKFRDFLKVELTEDGEEYVPVWAVARALALAKVEVNKDDKMPLP